MRTDTFDHCDIIHPIELAPDYFSAGSVVQDHPKNSYGPEAGEWVRTHSIKPGGTGRIPLEKLAGNTYVVNLPMGCARITMDPQGRIIVTPKMQKHPEDPVPVLGKTQVSLPLNIEKYKPVVFFGINDGRLVIFNHHATENLPVFVKGPDPIEVQNILPAELRGAEDLPSREERSFQNTGDAGGFSFKLGELATGKYLGLVDTSEGEVGWKLQRYGDKIEVCDGEGNSLGWVPTARFKSFKGVRMAIPSDSPGEVIVDLQGSGVNLVTFPELDPVHIDWLKKTQA